MKTEVTASNWRPLAKNTLEGFVDLHFPAIGLTIKEVACHERNGKRWLSPPGKPWVTKTGETSYVNIIDFMSAESKAAFQEAGLAAVGRLRQNL